MNAQPLGTPTGNGDLADSVSSRVVVAVVLFLVDAGVGMIVSPIFGALVVGGASIALGVPAERHSEWQDFAFMFLIMLPALAAGFLMARWSGQRVAAWVWVAGVLWIGYGIRDSTHSYNLRPQLYGSCSALDNIVNSFWFEDSSKCRGASEILAGLVFTIPALSAIAYSLGAKAGLCRLKAGLAPAN